MNYTRQRCGARTRRGHPCRRWPAAGFPEALQRLLDARSDARTFYSRGESRGTHATASPTSTRAPLTATERLREELEKRLKTEQNPAVRVKIRTRHEALRLEKLEAQRKAATRPVAEELREARNALREADDVTTRIGLKRRIAGLQRAGERS